MYTKTFNFYMLTPARNFAKYCFFLPALSSNKFANAFQLTSKWKILVWKQAIKMQ